MTTQLAVHSRRTHALGHSQSAAKQHACGAARLCYHVQRELDPGFQAYYKLIAKWLAYTWQNMFIILGSYPTSCISGTHALKIAPSGSLVRQEIVVTRVTRVAVPPTAPRRKVIQSLPLMFFNLVCRDANA